MFYTKLYAVAEYAMEILLVWAIFQIHFAVGAAYLAIRLCKFLLAPATEVEIQTYRMKQAVAQAKAMAVKLNGNPSTSLNQEVSHDDVTLQ